MDLTAALDLSQKLQQALTEEIARARRERELLRTLDSRALLDRAARRQDFNTTAASLERRLSAQLARLAAEAGSKGASVEALGPTAAPLAQALSELRALAASLGELDVLNHFLADRTLTVVRSYTAALAARPTAYDRAGRSLASTGT